MPEEVEIKPEDEIDCQDTDGIVCPWCGEWHQDIHEYVTDEIALTEKEFVMPCDNCGRDFKVQPYMALTFSSYRCEQPPRVESPAPEPPTPIEVLTHAEWIAEGRRLFGDSVANWRFKCPICGTTHTPDELAKIIQTLDNCSWDEAKVQASNMAGFSCIGRLSAQEGCTYTLGGLFKVCKREIIISDNKRQPVFEFATEDFKAPHREAFK